MLIQVRVYIYRHKAKETKTKTRIMGRVDSSPSLYLARNTTPEGFRHTCRQPQLPHGAVATPQSPEWSPQILLAAPLGVVSSIAIRIKSSALIDNSDPIDTLVRPPRRLEPASAYLTPSFRSQVFIYAVTNQNRLTPTRRICQYA